MLTYEQLIEILPRDAPLSLAIEIKIAADNAVRDAAYNRTADIFRDLDSLAKDDEALSNKISALNRKWFNAKI